MSDVILENANGVRITEGGKMQGHYAAVGALCCCGEHLIVAPTIYHPSSAVTRSGIRCNALLGRKATT